MSFVHFNSTAATNTTPTTTASLILGHSTVPNYLVLAEFLSGDSAVRWPIAHRGGARGRRRPCAETALGLHIPG
jgi:hypothetical protein